MSSDDEDDAQLRNELRELQELLGVNYRDAPSQPVRSVASTCRCDAVSALLIHVHIVLSKRRICLQATRDPLSGTQHVRHAALAQEWADIGTLHEVNSLMSHLCMNAAGQRRVVVLCISV